MSSGSLSRSLRQRDLVAVTINAIIGAGIFGLPGRIFGLTGPWSLVACLVCGAFAALIVLCFAEVGSRFKDTGGPYLYAKEAFGPFPAWNVALLMWLARVSAFAANANLLLSYLSSFGIHAETGYARAVLLTVLVLLIALVNAMGIRSASAANHIFTAGKLLPLAIFIGVGVWFIVPERLALQGHPPAQGFTAAILLLVYAFTGFEMTTVPGGEIRNPERALPRALLMAIGIVALTYAGLQAVCIGSLPDLARSTRPIADASALFLGPAGSRAIVAGIVVSIIGNLHVTVLSASRIPFALAENRQLPAALARTGSRHRAPVTSILLTCAVILGLTLGGTLIGALQISTVARLIVYISTCAALPVLRRTSTAPPLFRVPGGALIAVTCVSAALFLLIHAPRAEWISVLAVVLAANLLYVIFGMRAQFRGV